MSSRAQDHGPHHTGKVGRADTGAASRDVDPLGVADLTWHEVAESVWLAAAIEMRRHNAEAAHDAVSEDAVRDGDVGDTESSPRSSDRLTHPPPDPVPATPEPVKGWSLPEPLTIVRALSPLKRYVASSRTGDVVIDEVATAERALQDQLWWPVTTQRRERSLDLTVVIDAAPSMTLWRSKVAAFVELLGQVGAFRTIRVRRLDTSRSPDGMSSSPVLRTGQGDAESRDPAELLDHRGRGAVLVITDGVGDAWRNDLMGPMLALWGQAMPVSVINLLPQWMWRRTGLVLHRAKLGKSGGLRPNKAWSFTLPDAWAAPEFAVPPGAVPIPVLELESRWLTWWARLIADGHDSAAATVLLADDTSPVWVKERSDESSPRQRMAEFRGTASPGAQRLAQLLAALPLDLSVVRLVQKEFLPGTGPEVVAELMAAGFLRYAPATAEFESTVDRVAFDIAESDREILLEGARRTETARVVRMAAQHHGHRMGALASLNDAITDPDNAPEPEATADRVLQRIVLRALSGPYLSRANRLDGDMPEPSDPQGGGADVPRPRSNTPIETSLKGAIMARTAGPADFQDVPVTNVTDMPSREEPDPIVTSVRPTIASPPADDRQPGDAPSIWGHVPPRNLNFTGRADLIDQLHQRLAAGGTAVVLPAALHGMGGIGKTQTAVEYIYRHLDDYDLVWWIPASQPTQIRSSLTDLARQMDLRGSSEAHSAVPAVLEALRRGDPVRRWLLVFDAAESPDVVRRFFPTNGPGEILVTSRNPAWAGAAAPLEVSVFRRQESKELLRRRGPEISDEEADQLADTLGDLPLAIEQAAAWRAETGMPVREYLRLFEEKVAEIFDASTPLDYEVSLAAAWNVSFDDLRNRNPAAHQLLTICAFLSPEPITRDLFTGVRGVSISPELDVTLRDPIQLARAIRDINRYGLAKLDHRNNTIQLHRLIQLVLRNRITAPKMQAQMRHGAHQLLANLDPNDPESNRSSQRYLEILPHAYSADVVDCSDSWVRQLVINLMRFLYQWGDQEEAVALARHAFRDFTEKLGPSDPQTLEVAWRLGFYLWALGRYKEAAELNKRTLEWRVQLSGDDSEETLAAQANVLADLKAEGDFAGARQLSEKIFLKARRLLGDDDPETLQAAYLHGISLRLTGSFGEARELDENTYRTRSEVLGRDHPQTLSTFVSVVIDRRDAGDYSWARIEHEKLVERAVEQFGLDRLITQWRIQMLSIARRKDGDHPGALELSGPVHEHFRGHFGTDHPYTIGCALAHSIDLRYAGRLDQARSLGEEAFDGYRRILGEDHPHTLSATVDLAVTLRLSGDAAGARALDQRALERLRAGLGANHPSAVISGINLASSMAALGETQAAVGIGTDMFGRAQRTLGPDHPTTLAAAMNLVLDLRTIGDSEAEVQYADVMARYRRTLGEMHPVVIAAAKGIRIDCDIDPLAL